MPTEFQIEWQTAEGARIAYLTDIGPFRYTKALNHEGDFSVKLDSAFDFSLIAKDQRVSISRKPEGGALALDFVGLIRDWDIPQTRAGYDYIVSGPGMGWVLGGRVVAYPAGHASAEMTDQADDLMKEVVRDNHGADATTGNGRKVTSSISSTYFGVQANSASGPSLTLGFSYDNVLDVIKKIADAARKAGTSVYWELAPNGDGFEFRTNVGQLGTDRTSGQNALTFGPDFGNFKNGNLQFRSRDEINYGFALGQGLESNRNVQTSEDTERSDASLWSLREAAIEDTQLDTDAALLDRADALVLDGRPLWILSGDLVSTDETQYQRDWNLGDVVNISYARMQFTALIRAVSVAVDGNGQETVTGAFELL